MNCLQSRRLLLTLPRSQSDQHGAHLAACLTCSRLAHDLAALERHLQEAALVPIPEALEHRVLLRKRSKPIWRYAAAALLAVAVVGAGAIELLGTPSTPRTVEVVGPTHPGVAAIAEVAQERQGLVQEAVSSENFQDGLKRLGLTLKPGEVSAYYAGKCRIEGAGECEHIVINTRELHANVMLLEDYPQHDRLLVENGDLVALVAPAGSGVYIVVARSQKTAKRVEKLFVKS